LRAAKRAGRGNARRFEPQIETDYAERRFLLHEQKAGMRETAAAQGFLRRSRKGFAAGFAGLCSHFVLLFSS
jgi:hypothetical protein